MGFHPFETDAPHLVYAVLGGFVVVFGMFSLVIKERLYLGEAPLATVFGIIIGPYALNLFDPRGWGKSGSNPSQTSGSLEAETNPISNYITLEVTRVVLAIGVFAIGVELPKQYMKKHWRSLAFLLGPVMTVGWFVSAAIIYGLIPRLSFLSSLVIAACLTPTDPILAAAVVGGKFAIKHVPAHLRHLLAAESACNDGAAFPFLYIGLYLVLDSSTGKAISQWFYITWAYDIVLGILFGSLLGYGFRHLMKFSERKALIDRTSYVAQYISLALLAIGSVTLLGADDLLAAFSCGTAFAWDGWFNRQTEESQFSNVIDLLFNCAGFIYIGAWIPFKDFDQIHFTITPWRLFGVAVLILLLRRLPATVALYKWIPDIMSFREAVFSGHFGPMGVGAVFVSCYAATLLPQATENPTTQEELLASTIQPVVAFVVLSSIVIHGLSIPFFSLGRRVHSITYTYTYSRRQSMDPAAPDWITQVRRLPSKHAQEEIVINRDEEKTLGHPRASDEDRMERGESESGSRTIREHGPGSAARSLVETEGHVTDRPREMDVTDLGEGDHEWREGRDLVVEHQERSGDEVDVKVFKNVFADSEGHLLDGMEQKVRKELDALRNGRLAGVLKEVEDQIRPAHSHGPINSGPSGNNNQTAPSTSTWPLEMTDNRDAGASIQQEEQGARVTDDWRDEPPDDNVGASSSSSPIDIGDTPHSSLHSSIHHSKHRDRSRRHPVHPPTHGHRGPGRRRNSVRRALFTTGRSASGSHTGPHTHGRDEEMSSDDENATPPLSPTDSTVELSPSSSSRPSTAEATESRRGRTSEVKGDQPGAIPPSRRSSMRPATHVGSRTSSPMGRIRFADEPSRPGTPSILRSRSSAMLFDSKTQTQQGSVNTSVPSSMGAEDPPSPALPGTFSGESRVIFELPPKLERP